MTRAERLAAIEREEQYWQSQLALDERGAECCRAKLADLAEQRARLLDGEDLRGRQWPVPRCPDDS